MIIDAHAHIGHWEGRYLDPSYLLRLMDQQAVGLALVSSLDGAGRETDPRIANERTRATVQAHPTRFRGLVWVNPWAGERALDDGRRCLADDGMFVGLKFHPYLNAFDFDAPEVAPFLDLAQRHGVPVTVHTAYDSHSHPDRAVAMAAAFPELPIVLYHTGLAPPDAETGDRVLHQIAAHPNLYAEISWLDRERLRRALELVPLERILFGTDLPLGGEHHYQQYFDSLAALQLSGPQWERLMHANSAALFGL